MAASGKSNPITPAGYAAMKARYDHLLGKERPEIVEILLEFGLQRRAVGGVGVGTGRGVGPPARAKQYEHDAEQAQGGEEREGSNGQAGVVWAAYVHRGEGKVIHFAERRVYAMLSRVLPHLPSF